MVDALFMLGLLGIGLALTFGFGMRIATVAGVTMYVLMWTVVMPPENHPFLDEHVLGALTIAVLGLYHAGDTWGLGNRMAKLSLVQRFPVLR